MKGDRGPSHIDRERLSTAGGRLPVGFFPKNTDAGGGADAMQAGRGTGRDIVTSLWILGFSEVQVVTCHVTRS